MRGPLLMSTVLVLAGLTACRTPAPAESDFEFGRGDVYVAIGDSYTAAPLTGVLASRDGCGSTEQNYPHLVAQTANMRLQDNSCNGATTEHLTEPKSNGPREHPPQLEGIDEDTDLVTFRLGANDYSLIGRVILCGQLGAADQLPEGDAPCTDLDSSGEVAQGRKAPPLDEALPQVARNVEEGLREIRELAPDARIIVIGYPQVIPPKGECEMLPLPSGDYPWARRVIEGLNEALVEGAEAVDATYLDMFAESDGHDPCSGEPWVAGVQADRGNALPWHPYPEEQRAVADLVLDELRRD